MPDLTATTDNPNGNILRKLSIIARSSFDRPLLRRGLVQPQEIQASGLSIFCVTAEPWLHQHDAVSTLLTVLQLHQSATARLLASLHQVTWSDAMLAAQPPVPLSHEPIFQTCKGKIYFCRRVFLQTRRHVHHARTHNQRSFPTNRNS